MVKPAHPLTSWCRACRISSSVADQAGQSNLSACSWALSAPAVLSQLFARMVAAAPAAAAASQLLVLCASGCWLAATLQRNCTAQHDTACACRLTAAMLLPGDRRDNAPAQIRDTNTDARGCSSDLCPSSYLPAGAILLPAHQATVVLSLGAPVWLQQCQDLCTAAAVVAAADAAAAIHADLPGWRLRACWGPAEAALVATLTR